MAEIRFVLNAVDKFSGTMGKARSSIGGIATATAAAAAAAGIFAGVMTKSFLNASTVAENYRIRLDALLGSTAAGAKAFDDMSTFASQVPFEFEKIMASATLLSGVVQGGTEEIKELMPLITDLATVSGLGIEKTTEQIVRMFSAGAASADLFRERGINAMLGFKSGVQVSAKETKERVLAAWKETGSKFSGAAQKMAETWDGQVSMIQDKWFLFRKQFMDTGMFNIMKKGLGVLNAEFQKFLDDSQSRYQVWTENIVAGIGFMLDAWNGLKVALAGVKFVFATVGDAILSTIFHIIDGWRLLANLIPGIDLSPMENFESAIMSLREEVDKAGKDLEELANKEPPSIGWKTWADKVVEETKRAMDETKATIDAGMEATNQSVQLSFADRLALTREYLDADTELGYEKWVEKKELSDELLAAEKEELVALREEGLISQEEQDLKIEEMELRHRAKLGSIQAKAALATLKLTKAAWQAQAKSASESMEAITGSVASESKEMFEIHKAVSIANTIMSTYEAAQNVFNGFSSIPIIGGVLGAIAAGIVVAAGLQRVNKIKSQKFNKAHAGLGFVPEESTFLLSQGERVLAPGQNADLTDFLAGQSGGGEDEVTGGEGGNVTFNMHFMENATNADALLNMDQEMIEAVMEDKMIPALNSLYAKGIRPTTDSLQEG